MKNRIIPPGKQYIMTFLLALSIAFIAFMAYRDILGYYFTETDTFAMIDTSRIQSFADLIRIFSGPLMNGTEFANYSRLYRPILTLSVSLDYSIWGLNPFGYHLTNLILHIVASILVFILILVLTNNKKSTAWLGAFIFSTYPTVIETIPTISRREDILGTVLLVSSLLLFICYISLNIRRKSILLSSLFFYALSLGTKENMIILPTLIFFYLIIFCFPDKRFFKEKITGAIKKCIPFLIVTFLYLAWRTYVLKGLGGNLYQQTGGAAYVINLVKNYFADLIYPIDFLSPLSGYFSVIGERIAPFIAIFFLLIFLLFFKRIISAAASHNDGKLMRTFKWLVVTILILSFICFFAYPLFSPFVNQVVLHAYKGEGPQFLINSMKYRETFPVEYYYDSARGLILVACSILAFFSAIFLIGIQPDERKFFFKNSGSRIIVTFLLSWLSLNFTLHLITQSFSHTNIYGSVVPFSAILSIVLIESIQNIIEKTREYTSGTAFAYPSMKSALISGIVFIISAGILIPVLVYSPLVRTSTEWKDSGETSRMFFQRLSEIVPVLPNNAVLHIKNLPLEFISYKKMLPHVKSISHLHIHSIKSWLNLYYPGNNIEVVIDKKSTYEVYPDNLDLEVIRGKDNNVEINVKLK